jgi:MGT family glycosyltransferase
MSRFLFFNIPTTGHIDPTLPVAAELVRRGHAVDYFLTEAYRQRIEATGAAFHAYQGIGPDYFDELIQRFNPVRLATQLVETAGWLTSSLVEAAEQIRPQAIVYDSMCPWGRICARQAGLPAVASMALLDLPARYFLQSGEFQPAMAMMAIGLPWIPRYWRAARGVQETTGVSMPSFVRLLNWPGDHNISYTARALLPDTNHYGSDYTFVGPPDLDRVEEIPFPFDELADDRPLIYISLGTVFNKNPHFFRVCLAALDGMDVQVVVSTGRGVKVTELEPLPNNAIVRDYVPQQAILKRASLFISHSGANSVHHALYQGVPLLMVPQQLEQAQTAARIRELGAGLLLKRGQVTRERVRQMAQRLLNENSFRLRAASLGEALQKAGGAVSAAEAIEVVGQA